MTAREWKPGDVAMIEVGCHANRHIGIRAGDGWYYGENRWVKNDSAIVTARPLVVIDPEDREAVERLLTLLRSQDRAPETADIMRAALREFANPKPPKPEEPQGLGAVVEDEDGNPWVKTLPGCDDDATEWMAGFPSDPKLVSYADIAAVRVISSGVEVDQ